MKNEKEIREKLERVEGRIESRRGSDKYNLLSQRNLLQWVLDEE